MTDTRQLGTLCGRILFVAFACVMVVSCVSSGPATRYYSLFADTTLQRFTLNDKNVSMGIGPIVIPEYLDNPSVVTLTGSQRIRVAGYDAWAGNIKEAITRVLAHNISTSLAVDDIWAFPWDNRVRPGYQLRVVFEEFGGTPGGYVRLSAKWTLLNQAADSVLLLGSTSLDERTESSDMNSYVTALNRLLNRFSVAVSQDVAEHLSRQIHPL